ncbi:MAG: type II secretion system GspH family protein [Phycisphaerae bacterium]|nr:type II secretion system GspH family protein [Phycisphaerae bacterium]
MMKLRRKGFTLVELLVVIGIIALLLSIALPAFNVVKKKAKETAFRGVMHAVESGLEVFKVDMGDYPDSKPFQWGGGSATDVGAHILAEAVFGYDKLGYQKNHFYAVADGTTGVRAGTPIDANGSETSRFGPYIEADNIRIGTMNETAPPAGYALTAAQQLVWETNSHPVIFDDFSKDFPMPLLYYKANTRGRVIDDIYRYDDNAEITDVNDMFKQPFTKYIAGNLKCFPSYVWNPKTGAGANEALRLNDPAARPFKKESFILMSAGIDGSYGTDDDINNFTR